MRRDEAELLRSEEPRLLSTGEAARILGVSRQHVVDLCNDGRLPFALVGTHRRVRSDDVEALASGSGRLTRDQTRSLILAHAVAGKVVADPDRALALARQNLATTRDRRARGSAAVWADEWALLLDGPLPALLTALTSLAPRSRELRTNHPFAGLLTSAERDAALATATRRERDGGGSRTTPTTSRTSRATVVDMSSLADIDVDALGEVCDRYGVAELAIFGSVAKGEAAPGSDVDVLYVLRAGVHLGWAINDLADDLERVLGRPVDLVAKQALHPRLKDTVLAEARVVYAA